jgi:recombination protein RecA
MSNEDNKRRAEQVIAGLNATLGRRLVQTAGRLAQTPPVVSTTFPPLDTALGIGGIPRGQLTEIVGNPTSGMVTLALKILTTIQQGGERVVYLDLAATFNPDYAVLCGLNLETLWIVRPAPYALTWTILYDLVLDSGVGGIILHAPLPAFSQPDFLAHARQTFSRLQTALRRSSCVLLALTPLHEPGHDLRTCYPSGYVLLQLAAIRLWVQKEKWLYQQYDIKGYQSRVTVAKNKLAQAGQTAVIAVTFNGTVEGDGP